ncbi:hypothetical protein LTR56_024145 [Elasticomyces elasticus]|nr:hypothetical protein LTR56_024145 [Elasticomyces elasticus]KAK3628194.1 hypothetical protein LTR22_022452 [Elasticomyces elasticus]KAK4904661.1 hypothetical protein LTR49_025930 [Elasticomyces elasticus]
MSSCCYPPQPTPQKEDVFDFNQVFPAPTCQAPQLEPLYLKRPSSAVTEQRLFYDQLQLYQPIEQHQYEAGLDCHQQPAWISSLAPSVNHPVPQPVVPFPAVSETFGYDQIMVTAGSLTSAVDYLSLDNAVQMTASRAASLASNTSSARSLSRSDIFRSVSPSTFEMAKWRFRNGNGSWICGYPGCSSKSEFNRGCELRKHYKRHTKSLFCRQEGCPQATKGGFSSNKDRARHEAKHNPYIVCEWDGCERLFSRVGNMVCPLVLVSAPPMA